MPAYYLSIPGLAALLTTLTFNSARPQSTHPAARDKHVVPPEADFHAGDHAQEARQAQICLWVLVQQVAHARILNCGGNEEDEGEEVPLVPPSRAVEHCAHGKGHEGSDEERVRQRAEDVNVLVLAPAFGPQCLQQLVHLAYGTPDIQAPTSSTRFLGAVPCIYSTSPICTTYCAAVPILPVLATYRHWANAFENGL